MDQQPSGVARFFGYAMIAVGVLITFLSGACTLVFLYNDPSSGIPIVIGLPFILVGVGLIVGGRVLSRRRGSSEPPGEIFD